MFESSLVQSFKPLLGDSPKLLILGSMPGQRSLKDQQYYAHPANAFWRICADYLGFEAALAYPLRVQALQNAGIAVWDVLASCHRTGSLDANIEANSVCFNDIQNLLATHQIKHLALNGQTAARYYKKLNPALVDVPRLHILPSTSPAHASMQYEQKRERWHAVFHLAGIVARSQE